MSRNESYLRGGVKPPNIGCVAFVGLEVFPPSLKLAVQEGTGPAMASLETTMEALAVFSAGTVGKRIGFEGPFAF